MNWIKAAMGGLLLITLGCTHLSVTEEIITPDYLLVKGSKQITFLGDNDHPHFSENSTRLIFTSRGRSQHKGTQIYEIDLLENKERRVTFSDGDAFDATYLGNSEILYASTTDEIKETPLLNKTMKNEFPQSELYMSDLYGTEILRITQQPGYDGEPVFAPHALNPFILFSSRRGDVLGVYRLDLEHLAVSLISAEKDKEKRFPTLTPDRSRMAWAETDLKTEKQSLVLYNLKNKSSIVLKSGEGVYRDLAFAPRPPVRLFYSILRKGEKQYQIEVYDLAKKCTQVVFKGADSLFSPTLSDEARERIAFSRLFQDTKQIYMANLPSDLGPCLETPAQANLKE